MPSAALLAANAALMNRRATEGVTCPSLDTLPLVDGVGSIDAGPCFALANAQQTIRAYQRRDGVASTRPTPSVNVQDTISAAVGTLSLIKTTASIDPTAAARPASITVHPSLLTAAMRDGRATVARVWLMARHLDKKGSGWVLTSDLRSFCVENKIMGQRRLRQILTEGDGRFWDRTNNTSLTLYKPSRVANVGDYGRFTGRSVKMPVAAVMDGIHEFRASTLAAFHAGRPAASVDNPISRETLEKVTGAAPATQRTYDKTAGIAASINYALLATKDMEAAAWQAGRAAFNFTDFQGRHGRPNGSYIARQLPNSYKSNLIATSKNRTRRANASLPTYATVDKGKARLYCEDVKQSVRSTHTHYRKAPKKGVVLFYYEQLTSKRRGGLIA